MSTLNAQPVAENTWNGPFIVLTTPKSRESPARINNSHRNRALDGARALSALLVVAHHCATPAAGGPYPGVFVGRVLDTAGHWAVALLFLLSGYLLFREFVGKILFQETRTPLPHYFERRFLRIYPAYWLSLIGAVLLLGAPRIQGSTFGLFTLFERFMNTEDAFPGIAVYWTLSVEISFYVFLPIFSAVIGTALSRVTRLETRIRVLLIAIAGLLLLTPIYIGVVVASHQDDYRLASSFTQYVGWFGLGMLLTVFAELRSRGHWISQSIRDLSDRTWACWSCTAIAFACMLVLKGGSEPFGLFYQWSTLETQFTMVFLGLGTFFFLLPLTVGKSASSGVQSLGSPVMIWLASVSYGVYLWHLIIILYINIHLTLPQGFFGFLVLFALTIVPSLLIGWLSSRLVERPALKLAR